MVAHPDPNALVGVQKLAALNSNTATRHILRRKSVYAKEAWQRHLSYRRIADVLEYSEFKEDFALIKIGKYNVAHYLTSMK